jgi:nitrite reductase (NADH) small subunit
VIAMTDALDWRKIGPIDNIPRLGARRLCFGSGAKPIAVFRTSNDEIYALIDECPHRGGPLSEGIVSGATVACPLHNWVIELRDGRAVLPDEGATATLPVKLVDGEIFVGLAIPARSKRRASGGAG